MPDDPTRPTPPTRKEAREARLAAELRANLQRRKALSRSRSVTTPAADNENSAAPIADRTQPPDGSTD